MQQYNELANACADPQKKQVFLDLAAMEKGHKLKSEKKLIESIKH